MNLSTRACSILKRKHLGLLLGRFSFGRWPQAVMIIPLSHVQTAGAEAFKPKPSTSNPKASSNQ
jgi:hypothetical protein